MQNGMCAACHQKEIGTGWHASAHAVNEVACSSCHRSHTGRDPILKTATQPEVCGTCHQIARMDQHRAFAHPIDAGKMSCTGCHDVHGGSNDALLTQKTTNDTCFACHADKRGPFVWEHAPVAEDCTTCHAPHGSIHPGMLKARGPMLCQSCHSEAGHPSLAPSRRDGVARRTALAVRARPELPELSLAGARVQSSLRLETHALRCAMSASSSANRTLPCVIAGIAACSSRRARARRTFRRRTRPSGNASRCPFAKGHEASYDAGGAYVSDDAARFGNATGYDEAGGYVDAERRRSIRQR